MKLDDFTKECAVEHLENAIYNLDGIIDAKMINLVSKLKSILYVLKRDY